MTTTNKPRRFRVLPYRQGSKGASALATALGGKVLKLEGSTFKPRPQDVIINWGNTSNMVVCQATLLNMVNLKLATNKLNFFKLMKENGHEDIIPKFWTDRNEIPSDAYPIVCRTVLAGHSGDGIVLAATPDELVDAPLYVQYVKKKDEYRVHVCKAPGETEYSCIAVQRKARRVDCETPNWQVRNHANGFNFVRSDVNPPNSVLESAIKGITATDLDFGAIDVIYNDKQQKAYVLEINTAPGLEGQTVTDYANFFKGE